MVRPQRESSLCSLTIEPHTLPDRNEDINWRECLPFNSRIFKSIIKQLRLQKQATLWLVHRTQLRVGGGLLTMQIDEQCVLYQTQQCHSTEAANRALELMGRWNRVIRKKADFNTLFSADGQHDDQWSVLWGSAAADPHTPTHTRETHAQLQPRQLSIQVLLCSEGGTRHQPRQGWGFKPHRAIVICHSPLVCSYGNGNTHKNRHGSATHRCSCSLFSTLFWAEIPLGLHDRREESGPTGKAGWFLYFLIMKASPKLLYLIAFKEVPLQGCWTASL